MPYLPLWVAGDGDCFFHCIAAHERHSQQPLPGWWFEEAREEGTDRPPYHEDLAETAQDLRLEVARWACKQIFPETRFADLRFAIENFQLDVIDKLPNPNWNNLLSRDLFLADFMLDDLDDTNEGVFKQKIAFLLYWYSRSWDEIQDDPFWDGACEVYLGSRHRNSIYVSFDPEHPSGDDKESGLAPFALYQIYKIKTALVLLDAGATDAWQLSDILVSDQPQLDCAYVVHTGKVHFEPVLWVMPEEKSNMLAVSRDYSTTYEGLPDSKPLSLGDTARHVDNTQRAPLLLGYGVWNINHLPKLQKGEKAGFPEKKEKRKSARTSKLSAKMKEAQEEGEVLIVVGEDVSGGYKGSGINEIVINWKLHSINDLIETNNTWLDFLALNEVNEGVTRLAEISGATCYNGPHLKAIGATGKIGQHEYYPLLISKRSRDFTIDYDSCFVVFADGSSRDVDHDEDVYWMKEAGKARRETLLRKEEVEDPMQVDGKDLNWRQLPEFRPVVVHRVIIDHNSDHPVCVNLAIIHTTPGGTEFERFLVYSQLEEFFRCAHLKHYDLEYFENLWMVGGDYYLLNESLVVNEENQIKKFKRKEGRQRLLKVGRDLLEDAGWMAKDLDRLAEEAFATAKKMRAEVEQWKSAPVISQVAPERGKKRKADTEADAGPLADRCIQTIEKKAKGLQEAAGQIRHDIKCYTFDDSEDPGNAWAIYQQIVKFSELCALGQVAVRQLRAGINKASKDFEAISKQRKDARQEERKRKQDVVADTENEIDEYVSEETFFERNQDWSKRSRHLLRNVIGTTFEAQISPMFQVLQTVWGTNIHKTAGLFPWKNEVEYTSFRIADFVVCSKDFLTCDIGLFEKAGRVVKVDSDALSTSLYWRDRSDHFPIGGRFSTGVRDQRVKRIFIDAISKEKRRAHIALHVLDLMHGLFGASEWIGKGRNEKLDLTTGEGFGFLRGRLLGELDGMGLPDELSQRLYNVSLDSDPQEVYEVCREIAWLFLNGNAWLRAKTKPIGGVWTDAASQQDREKRRQEVVGCLLSLMKKLSSAGDWERGEQRVDVHTGDGFNELHGRLLGEVDGLIGIDLGQRLLSVNLDSDPEQVEDLCDDVATAISQQL